MTTTKRFKPQRTVCVHCRRRIFRHEDRVMNHGYPLCMQSARDTGLVPSRIETDPAKWGGHQYREPTSAIANPRPR